MAEESRVKYTIKNTWVSALSQVISLLLSFALRTIFIYSLGNEYLSINGLFTNILTLLSFAELGIGASIIFSLYEPIANNDQLKIGKLLNLFRKAYYFVAIVIAVIGLLLLPFLDNIITDIENIDNIAFLYILFLSNTVLSYIWGYKKSLLTALQKNYVVVTIHLIVLCVQSVIQIFILYLTHNYVLFLLIMIASTVANNLISTLYVNRKYPFVKQYEHLVLEKVERKIIFDNIKAIVLYKLGSVFLSSTNNIVISAFIRTTLVGIASNYYMIVNAVSSLIGQCVGSITASIGNYNVTASDKDNLRVFNQLNFISFWIFGLISVCLAICLNPFIQIWLGYEYILDKATVLSIVVGFYIFVINCIPSSYRTAMGLFKQTRFFPMAAAVLNLILSILFAKIWGITGIFWSTAISRLVFFSMIDSYFVLKKGMNASPMLYYRSFFSELFFLTIIYVSIDKIIDCLAIPGVAGFVIYVLMTILVYNILFAILHFNNTEGKIAIKRLIQRR